MTDIRTISTIELRQGLDRGDSLQFWNVQSDTSFTGEIIPGSRRMPLDRLERDSAGVSKDTEIVAYCGGPQCSQSTEAAQKLTSLGYTNVRTYTAGLEGWKAAGYAVDAHKQPVATA